ncbi:MAG: cupin protein [Flavipsychrobacter sp.]|jgi:uncharacterized protein YjlB|nr:cupin protein [Flavipsychrobacter sp.]
MMKEKVKEYVLKDNGIFPNSVLPVLHYKHALQLPFLFPAAAAKAIFKRNGWTNNWRNGIYTFHHYHSNTHEAMAVIKGKTDLQLGGDDGITITIEKGDVVVIPAGVAHQNLGEEKDVICVGGYPGGREYDMNYGKEDERPFADKNIARLAIPYADPVFGKKGLVEFWKGKK